MTSKKKSQNLYMIIMSFGMSVIMCAVVTAAGTGIHDGYIERFFKAWVFAFPVAVLAAFHVHLLDVVCCLKKLKKI